MKLTDLKWKSATTGWGEASVNKGVGGKELSVDGKPASYGLGVHAKSVLEYDLPGGYTRFKATGALDDGGLSQGSATGSTVKFLVFTSDPYKASLPAKVKVSLEEMGMTGKVRVRDLWAQKDLKDVTEEFTPEIPSHGAGLYRISPDLLLPTN